MNYLFNQRILPILAGFTFFLSHLAIAEISLEAMGLDPDETMIVTANRKLEAIDSPLARASVITRDDIDRSQAADIKALLQLEAGIDLSRTGGAGGQTSLFMRGTNSNHVLVLIDGLRVAASGTGAFQWELIDLSQIERIEIVRGPRASRWGSDAIGGVIQIFTRRANGVSVQASTGSYGQLGGALSVGDGERAVNLSASRIDGFSAQNERGFAYDPDRDGFDHQHISTQGTQALASGTVQWAGRWLNAQTEFDQGSSDAEQISVKLAYQTELSDWMMLVEVGHHRDELETVTAFGQTQNLTRRTQFSLIGERAIQTNLDWMIGLDGWRELGISKGSWRERREHWGLWSSLTGHREQLSYALSLRLDDDDRFGSESTAHGSIGWQSTEAIRWFASIGQGFRSPNFSQLFSPGFGGLFAGNPALQPETSESYEFGLDGQINPRNKVSLSVFTSDIKGLINFSGVDFQAININQARIRGIELSHQFQSGQWQGEAQWTWQDPLDTERQEPLLRRPKNKGTAWVSYDFGPQSIGGEVIYYGPRYDVGQAKLSAYTLLNLNARWALNPQMSVGIRLDNLTDEDYEPLIGFNAAGRTAKVTLEWQPQF